MSYERWEPLPCTCSATSSRRREKQQPRWSCNFFFRLTNGRAHKSWKKIFFASLGVCCNDYSSPARRRALSFSLTCFAFWNILSRGGQEAYIWEVRLGICESSSCGLGYSSRYHLKRFSWPHQQWCIANTREGGQQAGAEEEKWPTSIPAFSYVIAQKKETSQVELLAKLVKGVQATLVNYS